jgi:hypothetical protein
LNCDNFKYQDLFEAISDNLDLFGVDGLQFILQSQFNAPICPPDFQEGKLQILFWHIHHAIKEKGISKILFLIKHKENPISSLIKNDIDETVIYETLVSFVCEKFSITTDYLYKSKKRDGIRRYAIGIIDLLSYEILGYDTEKIGKLTNKTRLSVRRHKNLIINLNFKIPKEKKMIISYLETKNKLINLILSKHAK